MNFNNNAPDWENPGTEPTEDLKQNGFFAGYKPPTSIFNWFWHRICACIKELQEKLQIAENDLKEEFDSKVDKECNSEGSFYGGRNSNATKGGFAGGRNASSVAGGAGGLHAQTETGGSAGQDTQSKKGLAGGARAETVDGFSGGAESKSGDGVAAGKGAQCGTKADGTRMDNVQLGTGINNSEKTLQVYDYTLMDADGTIPEERLPESLKMFVLSITFATNLKGKSFTVSGSGMSTYSGTVPDSLSVVISVPKANTTYTVKCAGARKTITTGSYYGIYYGHVDTISSVLSENSWAQIAAVSAAGNAENYWKVGDEVDIVVNGETLTLQIYGFNHDNLTGGGKAGITFGMKNLMTETRQMNTSGTNAGGFTGSAMYTWLQNTLFPALPENLKGYIKAVDKKTSAGSQSSTINTDSMKLFLFSAVETGTVGDGYKDEGETYPLFTDNASRIKKLSNGSGSASYWWGRSPIMNSPLAFHAVTAAGELGGSNAAGSCGVCFGFCV